MPHRDRIGSVSIKRERQKDERRQEQPPALQVLCLCTGNSARSILAEALFNHLGRGRVRAYSAGSHPTGRVHPNALALLEDMGVPAGAARSKSWQEFAAPGAPRLDAVITVCDNAAGEACPAWPGHPVTAHWGVADPAAVTGGQGAVEAAFRQAYLVLEHRVRALLATSPGLPRHGELERALRRIGRSMPPGSGPAARETRGRT